MHREESCILMTSSHEECGVKNTYRLIQTASPSSPEWVYSIFLTTTSGGQTDEEFAYDIARDEAVALTIFKILCEGMVDACTLHAVLSEHITALSIPQ